MTATWVALAMPAKTPKRRHSQRVIEGVLLGRFVGLVMIVVEAVVAVVVAVVVVVVVVAVRLAVNDLLEVAFSLASDTVRTPPTTRMAPRILSRFNGIWVA